MTRRSAAGIVHRDVKPANVMLEGDRVVLADFGIAHIEGDAAITQAGALLGTPAFMAPERARRLPATPASDLWSLGATLYTAVEGRPPFGGSDIVGVLSALLTEPPRPRTAPTAPHRRCFARRPSRKARQDISSATRVIRARDSPGPSARARSWSNTAA